MTDTIPALQKQKCRTCEEEKYPFELAAKTKLDRGNICKKCKLTKVKASATKNGGKTTGWKWKDSSPNLVRKK